MPRPPLSPPPPPPPLPSESRSPAYRTEEGKFVASKARRRASTVPVGVKMHVFAPSTDQRNWP
ncbi:hypothetical protein IF2G_03403 [Cordyceps javanica]|nr:hypothetical protein IF2G_03403 [Cordyceps javanica]